jgi:stress-induced morphogen
MSVRVTIASGKIAMGCGPANTPRHPAIFVHVPTAEDLKERIQDALPGSQVQVEDLTGGGDHFRAEVVSERFEGLSRIEAHKLVYGVFGNEVGGAIHALSIKTSIPGG